MRSSTVWLFFILLCEIFVNVYGWGAVGHNLVVHLAQSQLTDTAPEWIRSLTPWHWYGNLSAMASWADSILYPDANPTGYDNWQWSRPLHYINIPDWSCNYQPERDCVDDICVAGAIKNYTKRLITNADDIQQKEALYFLIHFVGDIHQPLHTGFTSDRGANSIRGHFMNGRATNLHSLWDSGLITERLHRDFFTDTSLYYNHIHQLMIDLPPIDDDDSIDKWITENIHFVCSQIYVDENNATMNSSANFSLGDIYYNRNIGVIEQRLAQGGRRLGALLNQLAKNQTQKPTDPTEPTGLTSPASTTSTTVTGTITTTEPTITTSPTDKKDKLCAGTIALIAVLCAEGILAIVIGIIIWMQCRKKQSAPISISFTPKKL